MLQNKTNTGTLPTKSRALVLDDERFDRHRIARLCSGLKTRFDVSDVTSLSELSEILETDSFDLIFVDYSLPDGTGLEALELIRLSPRNCTAATILITGIAREDIAIAAMDAGCSDYIPKEALTKEAFKRAVSNALYQSGGALPVADGAQHDALRHFARDCAMDLKPMVSRMMRQIRDLRDGRTPQPAAHTEPLEMTCNQIWDYHVALQEQEGHPTLRAAEFKAASLQTDKIAKPPSPFRPLS